MLPYSSVLLFYRPKHRKAEAASLAPEGVQVRFREANYFRDHLDVEFLSAKAGSPPVNYPRVLVLNGSPNQPAIVAEYLEHGVTVEVVSKAAPIAAEATSDSSGPPQPDYRKMRKTELRTMALEKYRYNFPIDLKVKEMREWLEGQPWPPNLPRIPEPGG